MMQMLSSQSIPPADRTAESQDIGQAAPERTRRYGLARVTQAYALTLLAALLALPVVGAGLITSNNCQIRGFDCGDRLAYGLVGAIVLAAVTQLILGLHFRLGWAFWISCALIMATGALNVGHVAALVAVLLSAPGIAAWISEPPNRRHSVPSYWTPRYAVLLTVVLTGVALGLLW